MRTPEELIKAIVAEQGEIKDVFLTACGGSLVDLYPGYYFINAESETMHSHWLTAKECKRVWRSCYYNDTQSGVYLCTGRNEPNRIFLGRFYK